MALLHMKQNVFAAALKTDEYTYDTHCQSPINMHQKTLIGLSARPPKNIFGIIHISLEAVEHMTMSPLLLLVRDQHRYTLSLIRCVGVRACLTTLASYACSRLQCTSGQAADSCSL